MRTLLLLGIACGSCACGAARPEPSHESSAAEGDGARADALARPGGTNASTTGGPPAAARARAPATASTTRTLRRADIRQALAQGLGVFLQRVDLDDRPVRVGGKFHGFRIAVLRDGAFWNGVDLKPGDVVTAINGFPIERPEQAQTAFDSVEVASDLRVAYERDGQTRELVFPIVDER